MSNFYTVIVISLFIGVLVRPLEAESVEDLPDGVVIYQDAAGTPDENGWYSATSIKGQFSVMLPFAYRDWGVKTEQGDIYYVGGQSHEGIKMIVIEMPNFKKDKDIDLKTIANGFKKKGDKVVDERYFQYQGMNASQLQVGDGGVKAIFRHIIKSDRVFQMIIEFPDDQEELVNKLADSFLNSFRLKDILDS